MNVTGSGNNLQIGCDHHGEPKFEMMRMTGDDDPWLVTEHSHAGNKKRSHGTGLMFFSFSGGFPTISAAFQS